MKNLYSSPLNVYLCLALLALVGIFSGLHLPVSLFPNSSKPTIHVELNYGSATAEEFLSTYGNSIESELRGIMVNGKRAEKLTSSYDNFDVAYSVEFAWGTQPKEALKEVQVAMSAYAARLPREIRDSMQVWNWSRNSGFLALSFYSSTRSLSEVYEILEPALSPYLAKVSDAEQTNIFNPDQKEVFLEIIPETLAAYHIFPRDIETAVRSALVSQNGGSLAVGPNTLQIQIPRQITTPDALGNISIPTPSGQRIHLSEVTKIDVRSSSGEDTSFKTSGVPSIILFASPKPGANVKKMSEDIIKIIEDTLPKLPKDIEYKKIVDPSEFIRNAINNVSHEVALGAFLAVIVLYFFIGSLKNVITAAIEIPMSMILAFILMRVSGMNLNIISLGGLALSAGMNVDASVVVMENIFRHFAEARGNLSYNDRLNIIIKAVREVRFPIIASTIASLVVFLPLAFTSDLSYAILGDLAKTVVFSHGFSAIVALVLVPTVRLQLMRKEQALKPHKSPLEKYIIHLENLYSKMLQTFIQKPKIQLASYTGLALLLTSLLFFVLPHLPKEIIGIPDTDWIILGINTKGNSTHKQMESITEEKEAELLKQFGPKIQYTFTQIHGTNGATIMARLKDKRMMNEVWKTVEKTFVNTPLYSYYISPWNPAELPIPNPPHLRLTVRGGDLQKRQQVANDLKEAIQAQQIYPRVWADPDTSHVETILFEPYPEQWAMLEKEGIYFSLSDIADLARVATRGRSIGIVNTDNKSLNIRLQFPENRISNVEDLAAIPIGINDKLIPLKALGKIGIHDMPPLIYREDGNDLTLIGARQNKGDEQKIAPALKAVEKLVENWKKENSSSADIKSMPAVILEDANKDMNDAIYQLSIAIALSILLIFFTMVLQFGNIMNALLVLAAVPLGVIGVIISLWIFKSTISLNSALGVILLNGIAVANSIILVDFLKRLVEEQGFAPKEAAIMAARKRLRPILITSLTTLLGMLPIALGLGEGGRILQPLGIAVSGGLWISMGLTLFIVPALQVRYLEFTKRTPPEAPTKIKTKNSKHFHSPFPQNPTETTITLQ